MLYKLRRHPFPVEAHFGHSLVLTYAYPETLLEPLLPPGLTLDTYKGYGFLAIAMVQTVGLRPSIFPRFLGQDFFLAGYRIFARKKRANGSTMRGLRILRSDTDRWTMSFFGDVFTHYAYRRSRVALDDGDGALRVSVRSPDAEADLDVTAWIDDRPAPLPEGSPFESIEDAERFAGPLPFTFDYERETNSIIVVTGVRKRWLPVPVRVEVTRNTFVQRPPFNRAPALLANAFHLSDVPYRWLKGKIEPVDTEVARAG